MNKKAIIVTFIKLTLSISLIVWVVESNQLNLENIKTVISNKYLFITFMLLTLFQMVLGAIRTNLLMQFKEGSQTINIFKITWISSFISCVMPTSLFGDLFKLKKLMDIEKNLAKDNSIYASIFSKVFSVISLSLLTIIFALFLDELKSEVTNIISMQFLILLPILIILFVKKPIFRLFGLTLRLINKKASNTFINNRSENLRTYVLETFSTKKKSLSILLLSIVIQILNVISFALILLVISPESKENFLQILCIIPTGLFLASLPISISGLGVGHIAFSKLFSIYSISTGADAFSVYFIFSYIFNIVGVAPLILKIKKGKNEK